MNKFPYKKLWCLLNKINKLSMRTAVIESKINREIPVYEQLLDLDLRFNNEIHGYASNGELCGLSFEYFKEWVDKGLKELGDES